MVLDRVNRAGALAGGFAVAPGWLPEGKDVRLLSPFTHLPPLGNLQASCPLFFFYIPESNQIIISEFP